MTPFRVIFATACLTLLLGAGYLSYYGIGRESRDLAAGAASIRAGSPGGGYVGFGRVK